MSAIKTYDATQMNAVIGPYIVTDFESITVEQDEDTWSTSVGSGGELTMAYNASKAGRITIVLPQTNAVNLSISSLLKSKATVPVIVKDLNGFSTHLIPQARPLKPPTAEYAKAESGTREWVFIGNLDENTIGGN